MCNALKIKMSYEEHKNNDNNSDSSINIKNIISDIENGELTMKQIIEKYGITIYKYNQIVKLAEIKKPYVQHSNEHKKKPKTTKFKKMLTESDVNPQDGSFDLEGFKEDCQKGMKISELMEKYKLSLYQVRELRKRFDLKTK